MSFVLGDWRRVPSDPSFHAVAAVVFGGSVTTYCRGRWPESLETERSESPPAATRCTECIRQMQRALGMCGAVLMGMEEAK